MDRFIPNRCSSNPYLLDEKPDTKHNGLYDLFYDYGGLLGVSNDRILNFAPVKPKLTITPKRVVQQTVVPKMQTWDTMLDAPGVLGDYKETPLDWSRNDVIAVKLKQRGLYIRTADMQVKVTDLRHHIGHYGCPITSIRFSVTDPNQLLLGGNNGQAQLCDITDITPIHNTDCGNYNAIYALDWMHTSPVVVVGGYGNARVYDSRADMSRKVSDVKFDSMGNVVALRWSLDDKYIAVGTTDDLLILNDVRMNKLYHARTFSHHDASVKAIDWHPLDPCTLVTGAGLMDKNIRIWDIHASRCTAKIYTGTQITGIAWNASGDRLCVAAGYGEPGSKVSIYNPKNGNVEKYVEAHKKRIISIAMNKDRTRVAAISEDELLTITKVFEDEHIRHLAKRPKMEEEWTIR